MSDEQRRSARHPVRIRVRLRQGSEELETTTVTISAGGFGAVVKLAAPEGAEVPVVLELPDRRLRGQARVAYRDVEGTVGFALALEGGDQAAWEEFVARESRTESMWRLIGRFATTEGEAKEAARSVLEKGRLGILFKRIQFKADATRTSAEDTTTLRLHVVGENGEAYRVAFEKHGGTLPEESDLATTVPGFLDLARRTVTRVLPTDVVLRRSTNAPLSAYRVVELMRGGYAAVVHNPPAPAGLAGLHGTELIVVEAGGESVFPFFDAEDLERIAADTFRRESAGTTASKTVEKKPLLKEDRFASTYTHRWVETEGANDEQLELLRRRLSEASRVQTRTYGERVMRLYPDVWVQVQRGDSDAALGVAMEDGSRLCLLVLEGLDAPRVMRLRAGDTISVLRMSAQG